MVQSITPQYSTQITDQEIKITPAASAQLSRLMDSAEDEFKALRMFVEGGGCAGLTYGMTYIEQPNEYDSTLQGDGFTLVVDPVALNFVHGCEIDYSRQGLNEVFVFKNVFQDVGGSGRCGGCGGSGY
jgi:iron-sulfur cluster assembly accessory protein